MMPALAVARDEPLWEVGVGAAALRLPDYRGSPHARGYAFPLPYFVYRGEFFKVDRDGLRGILFNGERVDLSLSAGASLPVRSYDNGPRQGMPDLKPSVELGPVLALTIWRSLDRRIKLDARMPLRGAITVESNPRFIGGQVFPHLNVDVQDPVGLRGWNLGALAGPMFADARYNRYFYEVPPAYATTMRPAYTPGAGYAGMQFLVALWKRYPRFWVGGFARYDTLRGAAFEESPLVTSKRYIAAGIGLSWILDESAQRAPVDEHGVGAR
jgi:outer membrane scaffolding protein for murein synthesis (MipA/OmpV family)